MVQVVVYTRAFKDWQKSLYWYKHQKNPQRGCNPNRFAVRFALPGDWRDLTQRLTDALPKSSLRQCSYGKDRKSGFLGRSLFGLWGFSKPQIDALARVTPVNMSRRKQNPTQMLCDKDGPTDAHRARIDAFRFGLGGVTDRRGAPWPPVLLPVLTGLFSPRKG